MSRGDPKQKDDIITMALIALFVPVIFATMAWLMASNKIIVGSVPFLYRVSWTWSLVPGGIDQVSALAQIGQQMLNSPKDVSIWIWLRYANRCLTPLAYLVTFLLVAATLPVIVASPRMQVFRRYKPDALMRELSTVFTGTIPVLHLRKQLVKDALPGWRRQTFPDEYLRQLRTPSGARPVIVDNAVNVDALEQCLMGLREDATANGRAVSQTIGRQIVDLTRDRAKLRSTCFPDRMSDIGKVIYAVLAAHAFGGAKGVEDYKRATDELNRSCAANANGHANLQVAQWIYDKYRKDPKAMALFAIHHWEYTYLSELLRQAKRQGKCGHTSFLWLKPMNRTLFYVLNQVGRFVPHAEGAAAFDHHRAEQMAARAGWVLVKRMPDGNWRHIIWTRCAGEGLVDAWERFTNGTNEDDDWWGTSDIWRRLESLSATMAPPVVPDTELARQLANTPFDAQQDAARREQEDSARNRERLAAAHEFIGDPDA